MENIETIMIEIAIAASILSFLLPLILWVHNIMDKLKLSRIDSFEKFREKMKWRILQGKKLFKPATWFKPATFTIEEIIKEFMKMEEKLQRKLFNIIINKITLPFIIFGIYVLLAKNIGYYYIKLKTGYEISREFEVGEVFYLVLVSLWIAFVLFRKLAIYRINMFLKKFKEFQDKGKQKVDNFDE